MKYTLIVKDRINKYFLGSSTSRPRRCLLSGETEVKHWVIILYKRVVKLRKESNNIACNYEFNIAI